MVYILGKIGAQLRFRIIFEIKQKRDRITVSADLSLIGWQTQILDNNYWWMIQRKGNPLR